MNIADKIRKIDRVSTVFTTTEIQSLLSIEDKKIVYNAVFYAVKKGELHQISEGIFAFDREYSRQEFANKYRTPSYISLYCVLQKKGVVFQPYSSVYAVTNRSEKVEIDGQKYIYRKIKNDILLNHLGIEEVKGVYVATVERAVCDKLYLDGDEYFDNLREVNWNFMRELNEKVYMNNPIISKFVTKYSERKAKT